MKLQNQKVIIMGGYLRNGFGYCQGSDDSRCYRFNYRP